MSLVILFLNALILVPVTLLPIINPLATAPVFVATFGGNRAVAQRLARQIAINSWFVMVASMLLGTHILALFGISLPVVRLGGGLLLAAAGGYCTTPKTTTSIRPPPSRRPGSPMPRSYGGASSR